MMAGVGMVLGATGIFLGIAMVFAWSALRTGPELWSVSGAER
jgi:hypothetical protein